ncbi:MAG: DUF1700 domain-containing protein [Clostridiales bacterium]|nr:DUF1700 domain-containing protein [Clostridiales bacterium]
MNRNEYLSRLKTELKRNNVGESEDIIEEYEQHFAFKLADGFSEEEIAAKLGSPEAVALQFKGERSEDKTSGSKGFIIAAMSFAVVFEAIVYILFFAWAITVFATSLASAGIGIALITRINPSGLIPYMPYLSSLIFGVCLVAFAVCLAAASYYFFAYAKQIVKASIRWHKNIVSGNALPPLPWSPQFAAKTKRKLRTVLLWSVTVFGVTLILGMVLSQILSGSLEFWHAWNWFV